MDERLEVFARNLAWVVASGFTAFVLGMWARTGATDPAPVVGMITVWGVLAFGSLTGPARRGTS